MSDEIRFAAEGGLATIELARPKALNALTLDMIRAMHPRLEAWDDDDAIKAVIIKGEGEKAFCAGGDVRAVYRSIVDDLGGKGPSELSQTFFLEEYRLNHTIHAFSKPYVAILDGVTMGGGVGLSVHGSHRIVTERLMFAMPETTIGLFPDVGGGWFLPRLPGAMGLYLALTGARLDAAGAVALGIASHYVPSARLEGLEAALATTISESDDGRSAINDVLGRFAEAPGADPMAEHRPLIDRCFSAASVEAILESLDRETASGSDFARETAATLRHKCPTSLKISFEQLRRGRDMSSLADVLAMEYRMSQHCMAGTEFFEGVRAILVDKDHAPKWQPNSLAGVTDSLVDQYFAAIPGREFSL
ncbi:enoyl-CoA hydratase/isomerase family protein [Thalassobaculum sp.]|uniref:enoyl-CoA hydratase/isomerase family protein n=1 Tax=Thalassobaculum sp. TaxID=2022740 RepID=UPI0032ED6639